MRLHPCQGASSGHELREYFTEKEQEECQEDGLHQEVDHRTVERYSLVDGKRHQHDHCDVDKVVGYENRSEELS